MCKTLLGESCGELFCEIFRELVPEGMGMMGTGRPVRLKHTSNLSDGFTLTAISTSHATVVYDINVPA